MKFGCKVEIYFSLAMLKYFAAKVSSAVLYILVMSLH